MDLRPEIEQAMTILEGIYPHAKISEGTVLAWHYALNDVSPEGVKTALQRVLKEHKTGFFPTPQEFRDYLESENDTQAEVQWQIVLRNIRKYGANQSVAFPEDLRTGKTINSIGGWQYLCRLPVEELKWAKRDFLQAFKRWNVKDLVPEECVAIGAMPGKPQNAATNARAYLPGPEQPRVALPSPERLKDSASKSGRNDFARSFGDLIRKIQSAPQETNSITAEQEEAYLRIRKESAERWAKEIEKREGAA